jgi:two-component system nitrogen regulation response regulator NtrX
MALNILVIDDEEDIRNLVSEILVDAKFEVRTAQDSSKALALIQEKSPSAIILDIWLQNSELDGLGILEIVKKKYPIIPVIVISGHGTISTAITAIKMGAFDYIEKPFTQEKLLIVLKRACETAKLRKENIELKSQVINKNEMIGESTAISRIRADINKISATSSRVLIVGPIGSGKELTARLIHKHSKSAAGPFVTYSPTGLLPNNVHNDLFGCATKNMNGEYDLSILEMANNGTLYIDEVGNLPSQSQDKLLKFLQDSIIERNGKKIKLNIRMICSSTKDLLEEIKKEKLKKDLYHRLSVVQISIPSLFERKEDIPLLVEYFAQYLSKASSLKYRSFSEESIIMLQSYNWPGNIRQLKNAIEWALIMNPLLDSENDIIRADMLPPEIANEGNTISKPENNVDIMSMPLREAREVFERQYLVAQMSRFNNNISRTSSFVGMERSALHRKLKLLKIHSTNCPIIDDVELNIIAEEIRA